jgi:hypothetical protein
MIAGDAHVIIAGPAAESRAGLADRLAAWRGGAAFLAPRDGRASASAPVPGVIFGANAGAMCGRLILLGHGAGLASGYVLGSRIVRMRSNGAALSLPSGPF